MNDHDCLPVDNIGICYDYQRECSEPKVAKMVREWNRDAAAPIVVSQREDGSFWAIDGQHRLQAQKRLGESCVNVHVIPVPAGENPVTFEANLFRIMNRDRIRVSSLQEHRAGITAGDPVDVRLDGCLRRHGFSIAKKAMWADRPILASPKILKESLRAGVLDDVLEVIRESCSDRIREQRDAAVLSYTIQGLSHLLRVNRDVPVNKQRLINKLGIFNFRELAVVHRIAGDGLSTRSQAMARPMCQAYNKGLRLRRLKWTS